MADPRGVLRAYGRAYQILEERQSELLKHEQLNPEEKKRKEQALSKALEAQRFFESLDDIQPYVEIKNTIDCRVKILQYEVIAGEGPGWLSFADYIELRNKAYERSKSHSLENPVTRSILASAQRSIEMALRDVTEDLTGMFR